MATRAGVSESVFAEVFSTVEDCYRAAFEVGLARLSRAVSEAADREHSWLDRVRAGLVALLGFFDDEPTWARLLALETPLSPAVTFECRQQLHALLAGLFGRHTGVGDDRVVSRTPGSASPLLLQTLTGDLLVGGVFSVIRTSMLEQDGGKLVELAPSLMSFIVRPYLGQVAANTELEGRPSTTDEGSHGTLARSREAELAGAASLPIRATHRTTMVLRAIAQAPYSNNREVAQAAGLADEGQTSKLLARLERQGVIENVGVGAARGEPNAWVLTVAGRRAVELLNESFASGTPRPRRARMKSVS